MLKRSRGLCLLETEQRTKGNCSRELVSGAGAKTTAHQLSCSPPFSSTGPHYVSKKQEEVAGTKQRRISVLLQAALPKSLQKSRRQSRRAWEKIRCRKQRSRVEEGGLGVLAKDQNTGEKPTASPALPPAPSQSHGYLK